MRSSYFSRSLAALAFTLAPAAVAAQPVSNQVVGNSVVSAAPAPKKICKQLQSSYSRMTKRVCLTQQEWQRVDAEAQ